LLGVVGFCALGRAEAQAATMRLCFVNNSSYIAYIRAFSFSRGVYWPAGGSWVLNDRTPRCSTISCNAGEQVCFGGSNNGSWGVGIDGDQGCQGCCGTCDGGEYNWRLND
jgi:hypothetical protein